MSTRAVILLAGMGSRLGRPHPKALTHLATGETILGRQLRILRGEFGLEVCAVVGFKMDLIMEAAPDVLFAYNPDYDATNTAKSLLCAMRHLRGHNVLWLNGDVVFEPAIIDLMLKTGESGVAVDNARVGEEEVKYNLNRDGYIREISKKVADPLGEALGINYITAEHVDDFVRKLEQVSDNDYFERAMELLIQEKGNVFRPVNVGDLPCIEVDFDADLKRADQLFKA
ncbi:MAG TPA: phosphocholine cytidylyltransferase family protein [Gammaproteobacteria bacterium]|nr:phosphocholine cytidylyltransferase family protein [Gammaproteobacteria bacterium]